MSEDSDIRWEARRALQSLLQAAIPDTADTVDNRTLDRVLDAIATFVDEELGKRAAARQARIDETFDELDGEDWK